MNTMNEMPTNRRHFIAGLAATALPLNLVWAGDGLPSVVKLLAGFPAGGAIDVVARRIGEFVRGVAADTVVVENKTGAGGRIAIDTLRNGPADGSQWLVTPGSMVVIYPHVYSRLSYDPVKDLLPVAQIATVPLALAVGPAVPPQIGDVKAFVAWLKANPAATIVGSPAAGNITHFLTHLFEKSAGLKLQHVPYRGSAPAIADLLGGQIPAVMNPITDMLPHLAGGKLRVLGVTAKERSSFVPEARTFVEQGMPEVLGSEWIAMFAKPGTPGPLVDRMSTVVRAALRTPAVKESFAKLALVPAELEGSAVAVKIRSELAGWREVSRTFGFKLED
jgi:tripartite-type tricarboxylate transporter receptor subunit TctC